MYFTADRNRTYIPIVTNFHAFCTSYGILKRKWGIAMKPKTIALNIDKMIRQNIMWSIILVLALPLLNYIIQPRMYWDFSFWSIVSTIGWFFVAYTVLIVLHEACHLIGFVVYGNAPWSSLSYGLDLEKGIAFATTSKLLPNRAMKKALLLPFWLTGVVPTVYGFYVDNYLWIVVGALLIAGAVGDFAMYKALRKFPKDALVKDDPEHPTLYIYPPETTDEAVQHEQ